MSSKLQVMCFILITLTIRITLKLVKIGGNTMDIRRLISEMTLYEKASLLSGKTQFDTQDIARLKIPSMSYADGPHGIRKQLGSADHLGLNESAKATSFPTSATLANSWDEDLLYEVGEALGKEALSLNVHSLLAPGLNIKRNPRCGRNFEYFSEDPYISGKLAASYIRGVQANGTIATPKHFAVNSQEYKRMVSDSIIDERSLREIYLTGFEIAVKEGKAKSIMSAYNRVNGVYANESKYLLRDILVDEWNFEGFVVSDWGGSNDHVLGVKNGSHSEMPGTGVNAPLELVEAVESGRLDEAILDERVFEILNAIMQSNADQEAVSIDQKAHHQLAKKAAEESIVLLKNEDNLLPLNNEIPTAILGDFANTPRYQGAGSSVINPTHLETIVDEVKHSSLNVVGMSKGVRRGEALSAKDLEAVDEAIKNAKVVILFLGLDEVSESEGMDRTNILIPDAQRELLKYVKDKGKKTIVSLSCGSVVDMMWSTDADAIVHGYLGGQAGASAMLNVLSGNINPSGRLAETYPLLESDIPFNEDFPYKGAYAYYTEGIFVGYRYYDTNDIAVHYPFGYGLSYSDFEYSDLKVSDTGVSLKVVNKSHRDGAEVVQLYVGKKDSLIPRAKKELKGFKKIFLKAQEEKTIEIAFDDKTFRHYSAVNERWEIEGGRYEVYVGSHVNNILLEDVIDVKQHNFDKEALDPYYSGYFNGKVSHDLDDFEVIMNTKVPREDAHKTLMDQNSTIMDLRYSKSFLARSVSKIVNRLIERSERKKKPDLNLLFMYNMPFRAMGKMTNGMMDTAMIDSIIVMCNGHFFKGFGSLIKAFRRNRKRQKEMKRSISNEEMA